MRTHVSSNLLATIFEQFPTLAKRDHETSRYRLFLAYLLFGRMSEDDKGNAFLSLHHGAIKKIALGFAGAQKDNRNFSSGRFLEGFQKHVPGFTWHEYVSPMDSEANPENPYGYGKTRRLATSGIPNAIYQLAAQDMATNKVDFADHVYLDSLNGYHKRTEALGRKETLEEVHVWKQHYKLNAAQQTIYDAISPAGEDGRLLARLINKHACEVQNAIAAISDPNKRESQERTFAAIQDDPRIIYRPTPFLRTPRLHQGNDCVLGLSRDIRKKVLKGLTSLDLKNSQFTILAAVLQAPLAMAFAASPTNSLWTYLHSRTKYAHLGIDGYKPVYKTVIYSICFGMQKENLISQLQTIDCEELLDDPMIAEILKLRAPKLYQMQRKGHMVDLWGRVHYINNKPGLQKTIFGDEQWASKRWAGSLLGTYIQGIEMELMTALVETVNQYKDYQIVTWQHDGFTLHNENGPVSTKFFQECQKALTAKANQLGTDLFGNQIHSFIEMETL